MAAKETEFVEKKDEEGKNEEEEEVPENAQVRAHFSELFYNRLTYSVSKYENGLFVGDRRTMRKFVHDNMQDLIARRDWAYKIAHLLVCKIEERAELDHKTCVEIGFDVVRDAFNDRDLKWQDLLQVFTWMITKPTVKKNDTLRSIYPSLFQCPQCRRPVEGEETFRDAVKKCPKCCFEYDEECGSCVFGDYVDY